MYRRTGLSSTSLSSNVLVISDIFFEFKFKDILWKKPLSVSELFSFCGWSLTIQYASCRRRRSDVSTHKNTIWESFSNSSVYQSHHL